MFYNKKLQGEIATTLTIVAVILMGAGALIGGQLSNKYMTVNSRAESPCVIVQAIDNPHLNQTNKTCEVKITFTPGNPQPASPTSLTCALINPTIQNGSQLVARTNLPKNPPVDVFNQTNIGTFPLVRDNGASQTMTLSGSQKYRLVVYDWNNPNCKSENNEMPADTINGLFGSGGTAIPTTPPIQPTTPAQPTATNTPFPTPTIVVQCKTAPLNGFCVLEQTCNTMGAQMKVIDNYGCSSISSDYVCCVREAVYSTPVPTWTPTPTQRSASTPTPTTKPDAQATSIPTQPTSTPKPLPLDIKITSCSKTSNVNLIQETGKYIGITFIYDDVFYYFSFADLPKRPHIFADLDCLNP